MLFSFPDDFSTCNIHDLDIEDHAYHTARSVPFWDGCSSDARVAHLGNFHPFFWRISQNSWAIPEIEQEGPTRNQVPTCNLNSCFQIVFLGDVRHNLKQRNDSIVSAMTVNATNISNSEMEKFAGIPWQCFPVFSSHINHTGRTINPRHWNSCLRHL